MENHFGRIDGYLPSWMSYMWLVSNTKQRVNESYRKTVEGSQS